MDLRRGDILTAILPGDFGKPRPVVVVQADLFLECHPSLTVCPLTSHLTGLDLFRIPIAPDPSNGLTAPSEIMIDKISSLRRERFRKPFGKLSARDLRKIDKALICWLGLNP